MLEQVLVNKKRVMAILSILLAGGFLTISLISYRVAHDSLSAQIAESALPLTSDNIYSEIQQDLLRPIFISSLMAQDTFVRDWALSGEKDTGPMIRYLKEIKERYGTVTSFFVSDKTRSYYHSNGVLKKVSDTAVEDDWYFRVRELAPGEEYEVNIDVDTAAPHSTTVFVNYRVYDYAGRFIGATGVGLAVETVKRLIDVYQKRYGRRVFFINRQGDVTLHGDGFETPSTLREMPGMDTIATQILTSPSGSFTYRRNTKTVYLNTRLVPEFKWYLMVEQDEDGAEQRLMNTLWGNLLLGLIVTTVVLLLAGLTLGRYQSRLEAMAAIDKLTGATNRQVFEPLYAQALLYARRRKVPLSLLMFDIDHFKAVNDTYGHVVGDRVLRMTVDETRAQVRESDVLCRWGGEEFLLLLPDCNLDHAAELAQRIRIAVEAQKISVSGGTVRVSVSLGVAELRENEEPIELINRSDRAMYQAKAAGRNRVVLS